MASVITLKFGRFLILYICDFLKIGKAMPFTTCLSVLRNVSFLIIDNIGR